ncbi:aminodeoxychorismate lyase PabC [Paenibacillus larvae subsp. larvae]|uniref:Aminodeoxychorismate lyase PabC n=1 Tax=Paenibacillus larvae subsp. larvae TaxID=147375 RepID=A0A2L1TV46_9BACL|nr:aminodeoxychorismate lyase [Paenibacillus larvae]AQT85201.1 4-amino-4-deoxychorismate lyase [Paenibacillus larvae subsp. pulvifaciens]AQZ47205.1 4-amino-4-deoxychorismate lyase [Paenibacillus larvae subsp. pulvifaciens]AVF24498.1 aminodeoxychorismate lyase PabC [Paenibacillus larvae subsp. larvae]AVF29259.1 aminodeoxychorismate lyase PabC [Paenibacillus larvae subsp. larvae]MBH0344165.1 4-amino-4-deoxychorismate lyase [Paenibacillus larvae]
MYISVNGHLCDEKEAVVSVYDHGLLYGMGLFETFRTYKGMPFLLNEHLDRLRQGCRDLGIDFEPDAERINRQISLLLDKNRLQDAYFRYTITAGIEMLGLPSTNYSHPTEIMYIKQLPPLTGKLIEEGKSLQLLKLPRNTPEGLARYKSLHYMNTILGKKEMSQYPWARNAEGLMLTEEGYIAEGLVSNIFFILDGTCHTPSADTGILTGITRRFVMNLAEQAGMNVCEGLYTWHDLLEAEEILITNSIQGIVPIIRLYLPTGECHMVSAGDAGIMTKQLQKMYHQQTGSE